MKPPCNGPFEDSFPVPAALPDPEIIDMAALYSALCSGETDLICVLGPTASGKTRYAVSLAKMLNDLIRKGDERFDHVEIISADSRQVYRRMDIGTGKDLDEYEDIPYHLIDIAEPGTKFNLYEYQAAFRQALTDIRSRNCIPVLCGGTGLYIEAVTEDFDLKPIPPDFDLRRELEQEDIEDLREKLSELRGGVSRSVYDSKRRLIRALEVAFYEDEHGIVPETMESGAASRDTDMLKTYYIGTLVSREERNRKIDKRLDARLAIGMVEEVKGLLNSGIAAEDLVYYGLEYKFVTQFVMGILTYDQMRTLLSNAIHQFAKRQMTWFRGMERRGITIHWTDSLPTL